MKLRTPLLALLFAALLPLAIGQSAFASDDSPQKQIHTALVDKLGPDAQTIEVAFADGKASLTGKVVEESTQELAYEVALSVHGVTKVDNEIVAEKERSVGGGKLIAEQHDLGTESGVKDVLRREVGKIAGGIEVEACDGVVALRGSVPDQASHDRVLALASKVVDVKKVIDLLRIAG